ncbi:MAG: LAGLIDADG family homing endonuclease [Persephonella sp.]|nr:LAGLIDADG family homing endonuclease [Persephonella sp.]
MDTGAAVFIQKNLLFINRGDGVEALTFEELFEIGKNSELKDVKVLSADDNGFSEHPLEIITVRDYEGEMIELNLSMGRKIKVTKDHPVLIYKNEEIKTVLAEEVKAGDNILIPAKTGKEHNREVEIDVIEELSKDLSLLERTLIHSHQLVEKNFGKIKESDYYRHPYDVKKTGSVRLSTVLDVENIHLFEGRLFTSKSRSCHIPTKITVNTDFARLLGYFAAEGWISEDAGRNGIKRKRIGFTFGVHEDEYISDVKDILSSLNIHFIERISGNSYTLLISSNILAYIFENVLKTGTNSYNKKIPPQIFVSPSYIKEEYLKGLLRGDGCITKLNNSKNLCIELTTVSRKLAHSTVILLQHLGIVATIKEKFFKGSKVKTYLIRINGIENIERVGKWLGRKWENYIAIAKNYKEK